MSQLVPVPTLRGLQGARMIWPPIRPLFPTCTDAWGQEKYRVVLTPFLDIMHMIFSTSLFPRVGNLDLVHNYLVNMLLLCMEYRGITRTLIVCHIMWEQLYLAVMER